GREPRAAEGRVAAHGGPGAIGVVEGHPHGVSVLRRQDDEAVGTDARAPVAEAGDPLARPLLRLGAPPVEEHEVVPRTGHLVEHGTLHAALPRERSRSHQTIQTASRTIFPFILL